MPCNSEHCEPRAREIASRETAKNICYLWGRLNEPAPRVAFEAAGYLYGDEDECDNLTEMLCSKIRGLTPSAVAAYLHDGTNPKARKLADWWDAHEAHDTNRIERELLEKVKRDPAEITASLRTIKEIATAMDEGALTEEDIAEEGRKLAAWIDQKILDSFK